MSQPLNVCARIHRNQIIRDRKWHKGFIYFLLLLVIQIYAQCLPANRWASVTYENIFVFLHHNSLGYLRQIAFNIVQHHWNDLWNCGRASTKKMCLQNLLLSYFWFGEFYINYGYSWFIHPSTPNLCTSSVGVVPFNACKIASWWIVAMDANNELQHLASSYFEHFHESIAKFNSIKLDILYSLRNVKLI